MIKIKACSLIYSSPAPLDDFLGLNKHRPRFLFPFAGRFTYLDMFLSPLVRAGVYSHIVVSQRFAEETHTYLETAWGDERFKVLPFLEEEQEIAFDQQMYQVIKGELSPWVFFVKLDHPCWFDSASLASELRGRTKLIQPVFGKSPVSLVLVERSEFLGVLQKLIRQGVSTKQVLEKAHQQLIAESRLKQVAVEGYFQSINNLQSYIKANLAVLQKREWFSEFFNRLPLQTGLSEKSQAVIEAGAEFYRSSLADNCLVRGKVYDSILFPGVEIGKGSEIRDSILLPGVRIGANVKIVRGLVDAALPIAENVKHQIADGVKIGNPGSLADNLDHSGVLKEGFTFIGGGTLIPRGVSIGSGCYLAPGISRNALTKIKKLADGRSLS